MCAAATDAVLSKPTNGVARRNDAATASSTVNGLAAKYHQLSVCDENDHDDAFARQRSFVRSKCHSEKTRRRQLFSSASVTHSPVRQRREPTRECKSVSIIQSDGYTQLNQYLLKHDIGKGSYSIVKLAYNKEDDKHYAMKILSKSKLLKKAGTFKRPPPRGAQKSTPIDPIQRVYAEIAILKKLDHPNVVRLIEVLDDRTQDSLYMVFELVDLGEVIDIPTDDPLSEDEAWYYIRDVILGLEYLHYQKVIHRDIKPSNLLVTTDYHIRIADFGVSNEFSSDDDSYVTGTIGTPAFLAPECVAEDESRKKVNGKIVDVWALGISLFCFVYGHIPFTDDNRMVLYQLIRTAEISFPEKPQISDSLKDLIKKLLHKDPMKRITLSMMREHPWITKNGKYPLLPSTEDNCSIPITITEEDVQNSVRAIPKIETLILVRSIIHHKSFRNPYKSDGKRTNRVPPEHLSRSIPTA